MLRVPAPVWGPPTTPLIELYIYRQPAVSQHIGLQQLQTLQFRFPDPRLQIPQVRDSYTFRDVPVPTYRYISDDDADDRW